jgi:hypothetical protein
VYARFLNRFSFLLLRQHGSTVSHPYNLRKPPSVA